jgi:hypothetical protein
MNALQKRVAKLARRLAPPDGPRVLTAAEEYVRGLPTAELLALEAKLLAEEGQVSINTEIGSGAEVKSYGV